MSFSELYYELMALIINGKITYTTEDELEGGSGGTTNYNSLFNKPSLNSLTLIGDKTIGINDPSKDINLIYDSGSGGDYSSTIPIEIINNNIQLSYDEDFFDVANSKLVFSTYIKDIISNKEDKRYYVSGSSSNTTTLWSLQEQPIIGNGSIFSTFNSFDDYFDFCIDNRLDTMQVIQYNLNGNDMNWMKIHYIANNSDVQCSISVQCWYQNSMTTWSFVSYWGEDGPEYHLPASATDQWEFSSSQSARLNILEERILVGTSSIEYRTQYNRVWLSTLNGSISGEVGNYVDLSIVGTDYYTHIEDYQLVMVGNYICYVSSRSPTSLHLLILSKQVSGGTITSTLPLTINNGNISLNYSSDFTVWQNNLALSNNIISQLGTISTKANKIDIGGGWTDLYDIDDTISPDFQLIRLKLGTTRYNNNSLSINTSEFSFSIVSPNNTILGATSEQSISLAQYTNGSYQPNTDIPFTFNNGVAVSLLIESGITWLIITLPNHTTEYNSNDPYEGCLWIYDLEPETIQDLIDVKHELQNEIETKRTVFKSVSQEITWQDPIKGWVSFNTLPIGSRIISIVSWHDQSSALDNDKAPCFCWYDGVDLNGITTKQNITARVLVGANVDMEEGGSFFAILTYI